MRTKRQNILNLKIGQQIGQFTIETAGKQPRKSKTAVPLGEGGSGLVYLANQKLYQEVSIKRAIKFFLYRSDIAQIHRTSGPVSTSHFELEIVNLASINHENIVRVIEAGQFELEDHSEHIPYIVSEYIQGPTFEELIREPQKLAEMLDNQPDKLIELFIQLFRGIEHLHSLNFYHCDIAPKNIILSGKYPFLRVVITDLGIGHTKGIARQPGSPATIRVVGTRAYCPDQVKERIGTQLSPEEFFNLQPGWDIYGAAKTTLELACAVLSIFGQVSWLGALRDKMEQLLDEPGNTSASKVLDNIVWLRPENREFARIPELSQTVSGNIQWRLPISSTLVSKRIMTLANHPSLLRLKKLPQLYMGSEVFPGATHTRYEHSLGVYENMRRYLQALANEKLFLKNFDPEKLELALVGSLLSSLVFHPFSIVIKELRRIDSHFFPLHSKENILMDLMTHNYENSGRTLADTITSGFPHLQPESCVALFTERFNEVNDTGRRIIHSLLNSSIGVRVIDYLQRDNMHAGLSGAGHFTLDDLLPHIFIDDDRLGVRSTGLSVVEEIISLRYWLFNRVYWNRPSRSYQTMFRHILISLQDEKSGFEAGLREIILDSSEQEILHYCLDVSQECNRADLAQLCRLFLQPRPASFKQLIEINRSRDDNRNTDTWERISNKTFAQQVELQTHLETEFIKKLNLRQDRVHLLIDLPAKPYPIKMGEDLNVETYEGKRLPLQNVSGIVDGVQKGFEEHLQRFRIFINPETWKYIDNVDDIRQYMLKRLFQSV